MVAIPFDAPQSWSEDAITGWWRVWVPGWTIYSGPSRADALSLKEWWDRRYGDSIANMEGDEEARADEILLTLQPILDKMRA